MTLHVEIWSDIACPWCYVGKRRFERALAGFEHRDEVDVVWRAFQLDPTAPAERPGTYMSLLARKYGVDTGRAAAMLAEMTALGAGEGLELRFDLIRAANTFDGHRLVHLAATLGCQDAMKERLMRAYLCEGELISDHETLARLAAEVGLPTEPVEELLGSDLFAERIEAERELAAGFGVAGVPFFAVERKMGGTGAQPTEVMASLLERGWERFAAGAG